MKLSCSDQGATEVPKPMIFLIVSIRKFNCQAQELQRSKINDFLNGINKEIELSGQGAPEIKINDFPNRMLKEIELSGRELQRSKINDFLNKILNGI